MIITGKYNIGETVILKLETLSYEQLSKVLNLESFEFEINAMRGSQIILNKFGKIWVKLGILPGLYYLMQKK